MTSQTAVFETANDIGLYPGALLTFQLFQTFGNYHTLGRFRLSATTDDRSLFADARITGGDVSANWTVLHPAFFGAQSGEVASILGDDSLRMPNTRPNKDVFTVGALTSLVGITGVRIEALADPTFPFDGPGRQPTNGNFVLSEFQLDVAEAPKPTAVPEPPSAALAGLALALALGVWRSKRRIA